MQQPEPHEIEVARILARHFKTDVLFLEPINSYKQRTPDIIMSGVEWEIKVPVGGSKKSTVEKQIKKATRQSNNIVVYGAYIDLSKVTILKQIKRELAIHKRIRKLIFIDEHRKVICLK